MTNTDLLIGLKITQLFVSERECTLRFVADNGKELFWEVEGDCCSESWWADITGLDNLHNSYIQEVIVHDCQEMYIQDDRCRQEIDVKYGISIRTKKGMVNLVFRNSSNGYYGGWPRDLSFDNPNPKAKYREIDLTQMEWSA